MTTAAALTPQRARDLGRTLAHRLVPLPRDPAQLAQAASLALLSLLPTWLQPGEEGCAAALRQLVRDDSFVSYLLAPAAAGDADPGSEGLRGHLGQTFAEPLQPLLLQFSEGCREALRGLPASNLPQTPETRSPAAPELVASAPARNGDAGSLLGLAVAAVACFAMGWLGYRLTQGLGQSSVDPQLQEALTPAPRGGSVPGSGSSPMAGGPSARESADRQVPAAGQAAPLASLQCLGSGQVESEVPADPSNYGPRLAQDWQGRPVPHTPQLIVLHETVVDEDAALNLFRRRHSDDGQQASYHVLIGRDGRRIRVVNDEQRAFGAGDSAFEGLSVQLKPGLRPSINNVALHVSLVSPGDGADGEARGHSGYTAEQYRSLASQIARWQAQFQIPASRVVTHQEVDRSGSRRDPRSLDWSRLGRDLRQQWLACGVSGPLAELGR